MNRVRIYLDQKQIELAGELFNKGFSTYRVAAELGVNKAVIDRYRKEGEPRFPPFLNKGNRKCQRPLDDMVLRLMGRHFVSGNLYHPKHPPKNNPGIRLFLGHHNVRGWIVYMGYDGKEVTMGAHAWAAWAGDEVKIRNREEDWP